ncbi:MAG: cache domain-containing protein, partial [Candidatus Omnitrophica bacterium]|nr:cache domain-containing protein [Candidatus Omnitrophota bacterium]
MAKRISIRTKIALSIMMPVAVIALTALFLGYFWGGRLLVNILDEERGGIAYRVSKTVADEFSEVVKVVRIIADKGQVKEAVAEQNKRYISMSEEAIKTYLAGMDDEWAKSADDSPLRGAILENTASQNIRRISKISPDIAEIEITDRRGALVALSGRTDVFSHGGEAWWQKTYNGGKDTLFVGDIAFDRINGIWAIIIAVPIEGANGQIIGVAKTTIKTERFFSSLTVTHIGKTGRAALINGQGFILFLEDTIPYSKRLPSFEKYMSKKKRTGRYGIQWVSAVIGKDVISLSPVGGIVKENGLQWLAAVIIDAREVYAPLREYLLQAVLLLVFLCIVIIPLGLVVSHPYVKIINKFLEAFQKLGKGDRTVRTAIKRNDELGDISLAFDQMVINLNDLTTSRDELNKEIEKREVFERELKNSDDKLKEEAEKLEVSLKEAEDTRKVLISMLEDNNQIREAMEKNLLDLKEAQTALIHSEKLASLGKLVADIAHEVNNPLMIVSGTAQLCQMEDIQNPEIKESLKVIEQEGYRARDIIKRLLTFSRVNRGAVKEININDVLEETIKLLEHQFSLINVKIQRVYGQDLPLIEV